MIISKKKIALVLLGVVMILAFVLTYGHNTVVATNSSVGSDGSLTIWDITESATRYTYGSTNYKTQAHWNVTFYANYSDGSNQSISDGTCNFRFDENLTGYNGWQAGVYDVPSGLYLFYRSFNYKGNISWQADCTSPHDDFNLTDLVFITNTKPEVTPEPSGYLLNQTYSEGSVYYYNFSANCTDDDYNDKSSLIYSIEQINSTNSNTPYNWINVNSSGVVKTNATFDNQTGTFTVDLRCADSDIGDEGLLPIVINPINDAPNFTNVNRSMSVIQGNNFYLAIGVYDEENNTPFHFNVTSMNCTTAPWSTRNSTNCTLFSVNESLGIINFSSTKNDVGNYTINFSVRDSGQTYLPYNLTTYILVNFEVVNTNSYPVFSYACDSERNTTENLLFTCILNATDEDEVNNLAFLSNFSWFTFNNSQNSITINISNYSASANISFVSNDSNVGNWSVNLSVMDSYGAMTHRAVWFFVNNTADSVSLSSIEDKTIYAGALFTLYINATDDDLLIPDKRVYNENITFAANITIFNFIKLSDSGNRASALINFTPASGDAGIYFIRVNASDVSGNLDYKTFTLTIENNSLPVWNESTPVLQNLTEDILYTFNVSEWAYDPDNDSITFSSNASTDFPNFNLTLNGLLNFTSNDSDVGAHIIEITATDSKNSTSSKVFIFNVSNVNDIPVLLNISTLQTSEDNVTFFYIYAYDNDLLIGDSVYNESLTFDKYVINLTGENRTLFDINIWGISGNLTTVIVNFTPWKADIGNYTVNLSVRDIANVTAFTSFNITILSTNHNPRMALSSYITGIGTLFTRYINASDADNDTISFSDNSSLFEITKVNETYNESGFSFAMAMINFTPTGPDIGSHYIQINATDAHNAVNADIFKLDIYGAPTIESFMCSIGAFPFPPMSENESSNCYVNVSQEANGDLRYMFYLDGVSVQNDTGIGQKLWVYNASFYTEGVHNLSVYVSNPEYTIMDSVTITVLHANAPPVFSGQIANMTVTGSSTTLNLLNYFSDADRNDTRYNQTINFIFKEYDTNFSELNSSYLVLNNSNYTLTMSSSRSVYEYIRITAIDQDNSSFNATSNYFLINFTTASNVVVQTTSGGGSSGDKVASMEIIVPDPFTMFAVGQVTIPVKIKNTGKLLLTGIQIDSFTKRKDIMLNFSESSFTSLQLNETREVMLTITANATDVRDKETFDIIVNANSVNPLVNASTKIIITLIEVDQALRKKSQEVNAFLREFIQNNPECLELKEILNRAEADFKEGDYNSSIVLAERAIQACKSVLESAGGRNVIIKGISNPILISIIVLLGLILVAAVFSVYYSKRRSGIMGR
jgi:hypothetical protein